jgi:4-alpha-glucanotransferase
LQSFQTDPTPTWTWSNEVWTLQRQIAMPHSFLATPDATIQPKFSNCVLIHYRYHGSTTGILKLRPLIGDRNFHYQQKAHSDLHFSQLLEPNRLLIQARRPGWVGTPWQLCWTQGNYHPTEVWYWDYRYPEETLRGLGDTEDLYSPGYFVVTLQPGETLTLEARVRLSESTQPAAHLDHQTFNQTVQLEQLRLDQHFAYLLPQPNPSKTENQLWQKLLKAGDQFIAYRNSIDTPTIIAGFHWFNDWGRDTLIALPGLALTTQRFALAKAILETLGQYCQGGLLPNTFPDIGVQPIYNSVDVALWWIETLGLYIDATQDWEFLQQQYPIVRRIYKNLTAGTVHNIRLDAFDGLLTWDAPGVALTWMDIVVDGEPVTPRRGKVIEVNALWYSCLRWAEIWAAKLAQDSADHADKLHKQSLRYAQQAKQVQTSLQKFWNSSYGYFYDGIEPDDRPDPSIRPNAVIALSLHHCGFPTLQAQRALQVARDRLLTPYGLRSLDPYHPNYVGRYVGGIWERDRAYHQGTVWSWLIGPFIRAWKRFYPSQPLPINSQSLLEHLQHQACLGSISEIFDGDFPHEPRGAIAQAWSVAELIRHWDDLYVS